VAKQGEYGAALFTESGFFALPAYPLETVLDPTGAGDAFAGGFIGYLARAGATGPEELRRAMVYGSALGSFAVERFSIDRLRDVTAAEIHDPDGAGSGGERGLDGRRQVVGFLFPGDVLGIEMTPQVQLSAEAIGPATACRFDAAGFARLTTRKPQLLAKLHERARHELMASHDHVVALGRRTAEERIGWFLARLRGRRMTENGHPTVVIELPMPQCRAYFQSLW
jgi:hypothetical protein